jgi:hypothetical protein
MDLKGIKPPASKTVLAEDKKTVLKVKADAKVEPKAKAKPKKSKPLDFDLK